MCFSEARDVRVAGGQSSQILTKLKANLDESVALLSEQINIERTRVDAVTGIRQATIALNEEVQAVKQLLTDLEAQLKQVETDRAVSELNVKDIQLVV